MRISDWSSDVCSSDVWSAPTGQNPQIPHKLQPSSAGAFRHKTATIVARYMMIAGMHCLTRARCTTIASTLQQRALPHESQNRTQPTPHRADQPLVGGCGTFAPQAAGTADPVEKG